MEERSFPLQTSDFKSFCLCIKYYTVLYSIIIYYCVISISPYVLHYMICIVYCVICSLFVIANNSFSLCHCEPAEGRNNNII